MAEDPLTYDDWHRIESHLDKRLSERDQRLIDMIEDRYARVQLMFKAANDAVERANEQNEKRLDLLNEFRQQAVHEQSKFVQKDVMEEKLSALHAKIDNAQLETKQLQGRMIAFGGFGGVIGSAITALLLSFIG